MKVKAMVEVRIVLEVEKEYGITDDMETVIIEDAQRQIETEIKSDEYDYKILIVEREDSVKLEISPE